MKASPALIGAGRGAFFVLRAAALCVAVCTGASSAQATELCAQDRVDLRGASLLEPVSFQVELADTAESRAQGLMHRKEMAPEAGMLFIYEGPRQAAFWMKNTFIPLDILFLDRAGVVTYVHPQAIPHDETPIFGGNAVNYVLEINAGLAAELGLAAGAQLRHPAIGPDAAWPCHVPG